jgi:hypothetical protein
MSMESTVRMKLVRWTDTNTRTMTRMTLNEILCVRTLTINKLNAMACESGTLYY